MIPGLSKLAERAIDLKSLLRLHLFGRRRSHKTAISELEGTSATFRCEYLRICSLTSSMSIGRQDFVPVQSRKPKSLGANHNSVNAKFEWIISSLIQRWAWEFTRQPLGNGRGLLQKMFKNLHFCPSLFSKGIPRLSSRSSISIQRATTQPQTPPTVRQKRKPPRIAKRIKLPKKTGVPLNRYLTKAYPPSRPAMNTSALNTQPSEHNIPKKQIPPRPPPELADNQKAPSNNQLAPD